MPPGTQLCSQAQGRGTAALLTSLSKELLKSYSSQAVCTKPTTAGLPQVLYCTSGPATVASVAALRKVQHNLSHTRTHSDKHSVSL
jgi:hypothetical protein